MTEKKGTPTPPTKPDGVITTQRNGQTIVAELFFNHNATETFSDKLLKTILADSLRFSASDGQERFLFENPHFPQVKSRGKHPKNTPIA